MIDPNIIPEPGTPQRLHEDPESALNRPAADDGLRAKLADVAHDLSQIVGGLESNSERYTCDDGNDSDDGGSGIDNILDDVRNATEKLEAAPAADAGATLPKELAGFSDPTEVWRQSAGELLGFANHLERRNAGITAAQIRAAVALGNQRMSQFPAALLAAGPATEGR